MNHITLEKNLRHAALLDYHIYFTFSVAKPDTSVLKILTLDKNINTEVVLHPEYRIIPYPTQFPIFFPPSSHQQIQNLTHIFSIIIN